MWRCDGCQLEDHIARVHYLDQDAGCDLSTAQQQYITPHVKTMAFRVYLIRREFINSRNLMLGLKTRVRRFTATTQLKSETSDGLSGDSLLETDAV